MHSLFLAMKPLITKMEDISMQAIGEDLELVQEILLLLEFMDISLSMM